MARNRHFKNPDSVFEDRAAAVVVEGAKLLLKLWAIGWVLAIVLMGLSLGGWYLLHWAGLA